MVCPLCGQRKAKRGCPALGQQICAVCCGTKRLVEINCPADCVYLTTARTHPPAVIQRQQELDRAQLLPWLAGLSERQARLFLMLGSLISRHQGDTLRKLIDEDIGQAAEAHAATLETAARGIVYEHRPSSVPAERLLTELKALVAEVTREGGSALERDAAIALRHLEAAAKESAKAQPGANAFQQLLVRVLLSQGGPASGAPRETPTTPASTLIIP
jgi:hypothetical protein